MGNRTRRRQPNVNVTLATSVTASRAPSAPHATPTPLYLDLALPAALPTASHALAIQAILATGNLAPPKPPPRATPMGLRAPRRLPNVLVTMATTVTASRAPSAPPARVSKPFPPLARVEPPATRFSVYAIRVTLSTWTLDVEIARRAINTRLHRAHAMQLQILLPAPATLATTEMEKIVPSVRRVTQMATSLMALAPACTRP